MDFRSSSRRRSRSPPSPQVAGAAADLAVTQIAGAAALKSQKLAVAGARASQQLGVRIRIQDRHFLYKL
ncbi:hypothetical protein KY285_034307 [Solanum tuberosum]|nr:hypothetical protein KY285_034307 [Solanum tuberosum]